MKKLSKKEIWKKELEANLSGKEFVLSREEWREIMIKKGKRDGTYLSKKTPKLLRKLKKNKPKKKKPYWKKPKPINKNRFKTTDDKLQNLYNQIDVIKKRDEMLDDLYNSND
jgi:hypothetical protein